VRRDARLPSELALRLAHVADEHLLIARSPGVVAALDLLPREALDLLHQLVERHHVRRAAADVEDLALDPIDALDRGLEAVEKIVDEEDVAHLLAVAVDRDRLPLGRGDREPRDPALILDAELAAPVDARLAEGD